MSADVEPVSTVEELRNRHSTFLKQMSENSFKQPSTENIRTTPAEEPKEPEPERAPTPEQSEPPQETNKEPQEVQVERRTSLTHAYKAEKCLMCERRVFGVERLLVPFGDDVQLFHEKCCKCAVCGKVLDETSAVLVDKGDWIQVLCGVHAIEKQGGGALITPKKNVVKKQDAQAANKPKEKSIKPEPKKQEKKGDDLAEAKALQASLRRAKFELEKRAADLDPETFVEASVSTRKNSTRHMLDEALGPDTHAKEMRNRAQTTPASMNTIKPTEPDNDDEYQIANGEEVSDNVPNPLEKPLQSNNNKSDLKFTRSWRHGWKKVPVENKEKATKAEKKSKRKKAEEPKRSMTTVAEKPVGITARLAQNSKCVFCGKSVYAMEKGEADGMVFHKACFKCAQCNKVVKIGSYASLDGKIYCKPHFKQLFKLKGNYNEGFGSAQHKDKWNKEEQ
eukprot:m.196347 g.196347  ORF g.196347 m.196347 type:complete len:450 (+) comp15698_c1_seq5:412-1761(+)